VSQARLGHSGAAHHRRCARGRLPALSHLALGPGDTATLVWVCLVCSRT